MCRPCRPPFQVDDACCETPYDGPPMERSGTLASLRNRLEGWFGPGSIHNRVHRWVGGSMQPASSPNDPVFWLHHCNVDRLWAQWQREHPAEQYHPQGTPATPGRPGTTSTTRCSPGAAPPRWRARSTIMRWASGTTRTRLTCS